MEINSEEQKELPWKKIITFLVWLGAVLGLTFSLIIGMMTYGWVDDWEEDNEYSLLPFVSSIAVTILIFQPFFYLYSRYCIRPFKQMEKSWSP